MVRIFWICVLFLGGWLSWCLYSLQAPPKCQYNIDSSAYSRCFEPLLPIHERVDFELYTGVGVRPPSKPIWSELNVSLLDTIETSIKVIIPPEVRAGNSSMNFWFSINKARPFSGHTLIEEQQAFAPNRVITGGSLTAMRPPYRKKTRKLLEGARGAEKEEVWSISEEKEEKEEKEEEDRPHWKFSAHPLVVRIVHFDGITLATNVLRAIGVRLYAEIA